jgi:hypothetical protein
MGRSSSGRHLLELGSFKDSRRRLFFSMKSVACKKKRLPAIKSVCLQKKAFACNKKRLPAIKSVCLQFYFVPPFFLEAAHRAFFLYTCASTTI